MPKRMDRDSVDDLLCPVAVLVPEGANPDTTVDVVRFGFTVGRPDKRQRPTAWYDGFWLRDLGQILAGITIGPGTSVPQFLPGSYTVWIWIVDNPTQPKEVVDTLTIT